MHRLGEHSSYTPQVCEAKAVRYQCCATVLVAHRDFGATAAEGAAAACAAGFCLTDPTPHVWARSLPNLVPVTIGWDHHAIIDRVGDIAGTEGQTPPGPKKKKQQ